ncbi:hypothetical protein SEA_WENTWORTH_84 [Streptomyces phage Wentworth]|nr:hypothetical protein SEA_WENTWORTH_84 [Streptomyces phage Wentworth]
MAALIDGALFLGFCYVVLFLIPRAIIRGFRGKGENRGGDHR